MTGSLIQLVASNVENIYITKDPQITFFKTVYRRHTNFSIEEIPQKFIQKPEWGKIITCDLSRNGDLIEKMTLVVKLPNIKQFYTSTGIDTLTKFAWVKKIGHVLIKNINIEINSRIIDTQYGEWMNLITDMFKRKDDNIKKMIGDIDELTTFTSSKDSYTLYIPLQFWFCKSIGLALPIVALQNSEIKIHFEINDFENCYIISPTHYIKCAADIVNFKQYEYIEQTINNTTIAGIFSYYDVMKKRLYYTKITKDKFVGSATNNIIGKTSGYYVLPVINELSKTHIYNKIKNVQLEDAYLLVNYIYLDNEERLKMINAKHDYLIEQIYFTSNIPLTGANTTLKLNIDQPTKFLIWLIQLNYIVDSNDHFNYTDSYIHKKFTDEYPNYNIDDVIGSSLINNQTVLLNNLELLKMRNADYFYNVQNYQYSKFAPQTGVNTYFFTLFPDDILQPSGSCNMSNLESKEIQLRASKVINNDIQAKARCYALCHNVLRISYGLGALLFTR